MTRDRHTGTGKWAAERKRIIYVLKDRKITENV